jgi:hypothetical protein
LHFPYYIAISTSNASNTSGIESAKPNSGVLLPAKCNPTARNAERSNHQEPESPGALISLSGASGAM